MKEYYEGYWRSCEHIELTKQGKPLYAPMPWDVVELYTLPFPKSQDTQCSPEFISKLKMILDTQATSTEFFGSAPCRLCPQSTGNKEYYLVKYDVRYTIPAGYFHYLEEHNVHPTNQFIEFLKQF